MAAAGGLATVSALIVGLGYTAVLMGTSAIVCSSAIRVGRAIRWLRRQSDETERIKQARLALEWGWASVVAGLLDLSVVGAAGLIGIDHAPWLFAPTMILLAGFANVAQVVSRTYGLEAELAPMRDIPLVKAGISPMIDGIGKAARIENLKQILYGKRGAKRAGLLFVICLALTTFGTFGCVGVSPADAAKAVGGGVAALLPGRGGTTTGAPTTTSSTPPTTAATTTTVEPLANAAPGRSACAGARNDLKTGVSDPIGQALWRRYEHFGSDLLGCPTGPPQPLGGVLVVRLSGGTLSAALVIDARAHAELVQDPYVGLLDDFAQRGVVGVGRRFVDGRSDYQRFDLSNGGCSIAMRTVRGGPVSVLPASVSGIVTGEARRVRGRPSTLNVKPAPSGTTYQVTLHSARGETTMEITFDDVTGDSKWNNRAYGVQPCTTFGNPGA